MKKSFRRILCAGFLMLLTLAAGLLCACSSSTGEEDLINRGYVCLVVYDANGGSFDNNILKTEVRAKENSLIPEPGDADKNNAGVKTPTRSSYSLVGWYQAKTDESGEILYEGEGENRTPVLSDAAWNFRKDKVTGNITLFAKWEQKFYFNVYIEKSDGTQQIIKERQEANKENPLIEALYTPLSDGTYLRRADYISSLTTARFTILDFYLSPDLDEDSRMADDYKYEGEGELNLYAKYLEDKYTFISQTNKPALTSSAKWYFVEDVDFEGAEWDTLDSFSGTIYGNGFTASDITFISNAKKPGSSSSDNSTYHSLFGKMNGVVQDLTFKDFTLSVVGSSFGAVPGIQKAAFLATGFGSGGLFENVVLENCKIEFVYAENMSGGAEAVSPDQNFYWLAPSSDTEREQVSRQKVTGTVAVSGI